MRGIAKAGMRSRAGFGRLSVLCAAAAATVLMTAGTGAAAVSPTAPGHGYIYWTNGRWIGRAHLNGTDVDQNFITGAHYATGIAVSAGYVYWANWDAIPGKVGGGTIGRARLNGTEVNQKFITGCNFPEAGLTLDSRYIYWANDGIGTIGTIGRARLNGTHVTQHLITTKPSSNKIGLFGAVVDPR